MAVDGALWQNSFDMAWRPVFSPQGETVAVRVEKNGKYTIALNDGLWEQECDALWDPVFSPEGDKLLVRSVEAGSYYRRIVPVAEIASQGG